MRGLPGTPDIVFVRAKVAVFVDGDFWHGRDLESRLGRLKEGHNAGYWVAKVQSNVRRDREKDALLADAGWFVLRFWSTDVEVKTDEVVSRVAAVVRGRGTQGAALSGVG